jgi:hypothetical protein
LETSDASDTLSFDRASYETSDRLASPCTNCNGALGEQYWQWQTRPVCATCRTNISALLSTSQSKPAFARAVLLGGLTAFGCGIAYAVFVHFTEYQLALLTIGIAFVIAKVLRHCSHGVGGRKYQVLALALTYFASAMGYGPGLIAGLREGPGKEVSPKTAMAAAAATPTSPARPDGPDEHSVFGVLVALAVMFALLLAAPLFAATHAPIGLLIIGFGLWEAWKLTQGLPLVLDGPFRVAPAATRGSAEPAAVAL